MVQKGLTKGQGGEGVQGIEKEFLWWAHSADHRRKEEGEEEGSLRHIKEEMGKTNRKSWGL